jgi:IclR family transcriptional regulator, KDG regulon repressor
MNQANNGKRRVIASVQRAIDILNLFDNHHIEMGTTEIARALGLPKSTIAGLVHTLEANNLLEQNTVTRKYRLGVKLVEFGSLLLNQIDLRAVAMPFLESLLDWCNESVNLAVWDEGYVVYIERLFGTNLLGMRSEIGKREPIHSTALGKSILSCLSDRELNAAISQVDLTPKTPLTLTTQDALIADIRKSYARGYAIDNEENELGGRCVAAPILDFRGKPVAALSISVPVQRMPEKNLPIFGEKVTEVAKAISRRLGYLQDKSA